MLRKKILTIGAFAAIALSSATWIVVRNSMHEKLIKFDIGLSPETTAARTKLPLSGQNTDGYIDFGYSGFPEGVFGRFDRPGYEIIFGPLFSIDFFADKERSLPLVSHSVGFVLKQNQLTTHAQVYDYAYALINQFQQGKWQRYIPNECPYLTGKESIIDQKKVENLAIPELKNFIGFDCPIDPEYKPSLEEWKLLAKDILKYQWQGDGRIATLVVSVDEGSKDGILKLGDVNIDLEFELAESLKYYAAKNREAKLKEPWGPRIPKVEIEKLRIRDILEQRAGISVHPDTSAPLHVKAGLPCPRAGVWQAQGSKAEKRSYKEGEIMAGLHSAYGTTVWRWVE